MASNNGVGSPRKRCGARRHRDGQPCQAWALPNGRCKFHGGMSVSGPAHYKWKGGARSKYREFLPESSKMVYDNLMEGSGVLAMHEEIALLEMQIGTVLAEQSPVPLLELWQRALEQFNNEERALVANDWTSRTRSRYALKALLEEGLQDAQAREELRDVIDAKRKVIETESRRMVMAGQVLFADQAAAMFHVCAELVKMLPKERMTEGLVLLRRLVPAEALALGMGNGATDGD